MRALEYLMRKIDSLNEWIGYLVSWLTTLLVLVVCCDVFSRYVLDTSYVAIQELEWHLFAATFLLGAAYTLKHDQHVRVDLLYVNRSETTRAWINLLGCLALLIPFCYVVIEAAIPYVELSLQDREGSPDPGGLPGRYLLKSVIPISFGLLLLQGVSLSIRSLSTILGRELD